MRRELHHELRERKEKASGRSGGNEAKGTPRVPFEC